MMYFRPCCVLSHPAVPLQSAGARTVSFDRPVNSGLIAALPIAYTFPPPTRHSVYVPAVLSTIGSPPSLITGASAVVRPSLVRPLGARSPHPTMLFPLLGTSTCAPLSHSPDEQTRPGRWLSWRPDTCDWRQRSVVRCACVACF